MSKRNENKREGPTRWVKFDDDTLRASVSRARGRRNHKKSGGLGISISTVRGKKRQEISQESKSLGPISGRGKGCTQCGGHRGGPKREKGKKTKMRGGRERNAKGFITGGNEQKTRLKQSSKDK